MREMIQGVFQNSVFHLVQDEPASLDLLKSGDKGPVVFESLREDRCFLSEHLDRLFRSIELLQIKLDGSISRKVIQEALSKTLEANTITQPLRVKIQVTTHEFVVLIQPLDPWPESLEVIEYLYHRPHPEVKYDTDHYAKCRKEAKRLNVDELIFVDEDGFIREGSVTNVFLVIEGVLVTPKEQILRGIIREEVVEKALQKGIKVEEREVCRSEVDRADEIFVTNSLRGVVPVKGWGKWQKKSHVVCENLVTLLGLGKSS